MIPLLYREPFEFAKCVTGRCPLAPIWPQILVIAGIAEESRKGDCRWTFRSAILAAKRICQLSSGAAVYAEALTIRMRLLKMAHGVLLERLSAYQRKTTRCGPGAWLRAPVNYAAAKKNPDPLANEKERKNELDALLQSKYRLTITRTIGTRCVLYSRPGESAIYRPWPRDIQRH